MVVPGAEKSFDEFDADDTYCRGVADQRVGVSPEQVAGEATAAGAVVGTLLGGAVGAAIGAAAGNPGLGAATGAGFGLLGGTSVGVANAQMGAWSVQRSYDIAYAQCMQASGNRVPMRRVPRYGPPPSYYGPYGPPPPFGPDGPPPPYGDPPPPPGYG
jgi:hypothetical protein